MGQYRIGDIAQELGISVSTVSKAINRKPGVSKAMRSRVLSHCDKVNYRPNPFAQDFARQTKNPQLSGLRNIGYLLVGSPLSQQPYAQFLDGLAEATATEHYSLMPATIAEDTQHLEQLPSFIREGRVAGVFLSGTVNESIISLLRAHGVRYVLVGAYDPVLVDEAPAVGFDIDGGMSRIVAKLKAIGRRHIAMVEPNTGTYYQSRLFGALRTALRQHGLTNNEELHFPTELYGAEAVRALQKHVQIHDGHWDALICPNDRMGTLLSGALAIQHGTKNLPLSFVTAKETQLIHCSDIWRLDYRHRDLAARGLTLLLDLIAEGDSGDEEGINLQIRPRITQDLEP